MRNSPSTRAAHRDGHGLPASYGEAPSIPIGYIDQATCAAAMRVLSIIKLLAVTLKATAAGVKDNRGRIAEIAALRILSKVPDCIVEN